MFLLKYTHSYSPSVVAFAKDSARERQRPGPPTNNQPPPPPSPLVYSFSFCSLTYTNASHSAFPKQNKPISFLNLYMGLCCVCVLYSYTIRLPRPACAPIQMYCTIILKQPTISIYRHCVLSLLPLRARFFVYPYLI